MIEKAFFVVLVVTAVAVGAVIWKRRKTKPQLRQEQPCRSYKPELDDEAVE